MRRKRRGGRALAFFPLVAAVVFLGWLVPERASASSSLRPESTRCTKLRLLKAYGDTFGGPPQLVILGSSRALRADSALLAERLGLRVFNAAVGSGTPADALAFVRLIKRLYPDRPFGILWLLDIEQLRLSGLSDRLRSVPELLAALPEGVQNGSPEARDVAADDAEETDGGSLRSALGVHTPTAPREVHTDPRSRWHPDGYLAWCSYDYDRLHGVTAATRVRVQLTFYRKFYPARWRNGISRWSMYCVQAVLREAAAMKVTPVVALTPYHPALKSFIVGRGWNTVHAAVLAYLCGLRSAAPLRVLDLTSLASFGGWPDGFFDGVHPRPIMARRFLEAISRKAAPALRPPPEPPPSPSPTPPSGPSPSPSVAPPAPAASGRVV